MGSPTQRAHFKLLIIKNYELNFFSFDRELIVKQ